METNLLMKYVGECKLKLKFPMHIRVVDRVIVIVKPFSQFFVGISSQKKFIFLKTFKNNFHLFPKTCKISLLRTDLPPFI